MAAHDLELRRMPYPFRAVLAICSDLDETPDGPAYLEIMRFLNTTAETSMGPGVGLEVGNSLYFDMPPGQFSYRNTDEAGREMVRALIRSGHIDCLHSYGDLATTRDDARRALDELAGHDCRLGVWVDHGTAASNFGSDIMQGHGDEPGHAAYHADLAVGYGIQYVWRGRVTSVIGQDAAPRLSGIFSPRRPLRSAKTVAKELAKQTLARRGHEKYAMHATNDVLRPVQLRDGSAVYEFLRSNPHWGGVSAGDTARGIGAVLSDSFLKHLVERQGVCVLYTHLGKTGDPRVPFDPAARAGFRRLAEASRRGEVLVATTRRLLGYCRARREIDFIASAGNENRHIALNTAPSGGAIGRPLAVSDLAGLTFYTAKPEVTRITVDGRDVANLVCNPPDQTGRRSVSLPWTRLEFPGL